MKNPVRNETSVILVVAVVFSAVAIPVMSGLLEPSQPPAVAAVQVGDPRDRPSRNHGASAGENSVIKPAPARFERRRQPPQRERPTRPASAQPAPPPPGALAEDDEGEAD